MNGLLIICLRLETTIYSSCNIVCFSMTQLKRLLIWNESVDSLNMYILSCERHLCRYMNDTQEHVMKSIFFMTVNCDE